MQKKIFTLFVGALFIFTAFSQSSWEPTQGAVLDGKTIGKLSLSNFAFRSVGISAERILNKRFSAVLGINVTPKGKMPLGSTISNAIGSDEDNILSSLRISTFSLTPELRFYTGSGYGKGFYVAPYYRFDNFNLSNLQFDYTDVNDKNQKAEVGGKFNAHSGGILFGYQWLAGKNKNIAIDWSIFGVHYGVSSGNFEGKFSQSLSAEEQANLKESIDESLGDISIIKHKSEVSSNAANIKIDGPWAFVRGSLSVGYRF